MTSIARVGRTPLFGDMSPDAAHASIKFLLGTGVTRAQAVTLPPDGATPAPRRFAVLVDRASTTGAVLCAVHSVLHGLLFPFVLALLPSLGLGLPMGHTFECVFVTGIAALACAGIPMGYRRHHKPQALFLTALGIALLVFGIAIDNAHAIIHVASVVCGGLLVASAQITNLVLAHRHRFAPCARGVDTLDRTRAK